MVKQESGPLEIGAEMDYSEHDKTYNIFLIGSKYGTLICLALLIAMAVGFFTSGGFIAGIIVFALSIYLGRMLMNLVL